MLNRSAQIGLKVEGTEGTEETLLAAHYSGNRKESSNRLTRTEYERDLQRSSLTRLGVLPGPRLQNINFTEEIVGGAASTAAPWHTTLAALGFAGVGLKVVTAATITDGPFKTGQIVGNHATQGSATKTAVFVKQIAGSPNKLVYMLLTGSDFSSADTMYNYATTQTSASLSGSAAAAAAGYGFRPVSETDSVVPSSVTAERRLGGLRHTIVGARATGGLTIKHGEPLLLRCELQGCPVLDSGGAPRTGSPVASVPSVGAAPVVGKGVPFILRDDADYKPICTMLDVRIENALAGRPTINDHDFVSSGYLATRITGRKISASIDPEMVLPATFDAVGLLHSGSTLEMLLEVGGTTQTNGLVIVHAGAAQHVGDFEPGDRDGVTTAPVTLDFTGTADDEFSIFHVFTS